MTRTNLYVAAGMDEIVHRLAVGIEAVDAFGLPPIGGDFHAYVETGADATKVRMAAEARMVAQERKAEQEGESSRPSASTKTSIARWSAKSRISRIFSRPASSSWVTPAACRICR